MFCKPCHGHLLKTEIVECPSCRTKFASKGEVPRVLAPETCEFDGKTERMYRDVQMKCPQGSSILCSKDLGSEQRSGARPVGYQAARKSTEVTARK